MIRLAVFLALLATSAAAQQPPCVTHDSLPDVMGQRLGMELVAAPTGVMRNLTGGVEFWVSADGDWIMFLIGNDGMACALMHGTGWWFGEGT